MRQQVQRVVKIAEQVGVPANQGNAIRDIVTRKLSRAPKASPTLVRRGAALLPEVEARLRKVHGTAPLGNKRNALDELVFIQLTVRTRESAYQSTYPALRRLVGGAWERLLDLPPEHVVRALHGGGMARVKLARLRGMFERIRDRFGRLTLAPLKRMSDVEAESFLRSLPGVGPKVARCVLLYSLDRAVFPVDSHCRRVMERLGFLPSEVDIKASHDFLQPIVPSKIRGSLHVNFVHHGRSVCVSGQPRCEACVLADLCPTGQQSLTRASQHVLSSR